MYERANQRLSVESVELMPIGQLRSFRLLIQPFLITEKPSFKMLDFLQASFFVLRTVHLFSHRDGRDEEQEYQDGQSSLEKRASQVGSKVKIRL